MLNLLNKINISYKIFKEINFIKKKKIRFIFYSESKSYQKYSYLLIKTLSSIYPKEVYYVTSDIDDKINDPKIINIYIGDGFLRQFFFTTIKAENIFLTLTDLGNHFLKKTKYIKNYIYYFHSPVSTTKVYTKGAFDNYDTILCNGEYQVQEIKQRENLNKLTKKKLIQSGYFYFDHLRNNINLNEKTDKILIAPSWNYNEKYFINEFFADIIDFLLKKNFKVIFRPHPEHLKRSKVVLDKIKKNLINKNFSLDTYSENIGSMQNAKCLITDNSGIALEYTLILKRPVLYLDDKEKLHNSELTDYVNLNNLEDSVKNVFGYKFKREDVHSIDSLINKSIKDFNSRNSEIDKFVNKNFYNNSNIIKFLKNSMNDIIY
tara:strand:- start:1127 stop:2254 length:1128 start_codon:yes stop_codon:yes gene_type:complete